MNLRIEIAFLTALALVGCTAQPTLYKPTIDGTGYSQQQLDSRTWRVQFAGNSYTPRATVENYLLYRSAEIMLFGGFDRFLILEKDVERDVTYYGSGGYRPHFGLGLGLGHHRGFHHSHIHYSPARYHTIVSYSATATIRAYAGGSSPADATVFHARELIQQLGPTVVLPAEGPG